MELQVYDENGIFSIVNIQNYQSFVDDDWSLEQLINHFVIQMNKQTCIVWQVSNEGGGDWILQILENKSEKNSFRECTKTIEVTNNVLHFVNYTNLTMAAQFIDNKISTDWKIELENGYYEITIRQMFNPYDYEIEQEEVFEVIPRQITLENLNKVEQVFWWNE